MSVELRTFASKEHEPYFMAGNLPAVALLVHGFPGTPYELRAVGEMLHQCGLNVEGMLLPGFGQDFVNVGRYRTEDWLAAVLQRLESLQRDFAHVLLVGNSMGASLALLAASRHPVNGLLLFAPWWRLQQRWLDRAFPLFAPLAPPLRVFSKARFDDPRFRAALIRIFPGTDLDDPEVQQAIRELALPIGVLAEVRRAGRMAGAAAPAVAAPTFIMQGARDLLVHPAVTAELVRQLPHAVGIAVADGDHELAHMANERERLLAPLITHFALMIAHRSGKTL